MDDPIFIVGLPRSGSTLWLNLITMNSEIFEIGELLFLTPAWRKDFRYFLRTAVDDLSKNENIRRMIDLMFSGRKVPGITASFWQYTAKNYNDQDLKESIYRRILESDRSLRSVFDALIDETPRHYGFNRCCVKFPVFVNYIPQLLEWYPKGKIIHITRDPRAMAISRAGFRGEKILRNRKIMMLFVILQYVWTSRLHCQYNGIENYALFRYEDLLIDPEKIIRELCDFAEIDFVPQMLEPREGQASSVTGKKSAGFDKKAASHWRKAISPLEEKVITILTRRSMKRFGYDPMNYPVFIKQ